MNLTNLKAAQGTGMIRSHRVRDAQPNPFVDPEFEGNLQMSFDLGKDFEVTVGGWWEVDTIKRGEDAGQETERLRGDAQEVVKLLRAAATELGLGVTIQTFDATPDGAGEGEELVLVKYQATKRRQYSARDTAPENDE